MALIFGGFSSENSDELLSIIRKHRKISRWEGSVEFEVKYSNFAGAYIYNPLFPFSHDDIFYQNEQEEILILFSGEIFNSDHLANKYLIKNIPIKDPELIFQLFQILGKDFVNELNGDFSFSLYNKKINALLLYTDHIGIRPMSYILINRSYYFSNDSFGLCKAVNQDNALNDDFIIRNLLYFGMNSVNLINDYAVLPNKNVTRIMPAHYVEIIDNNIKTNKYWLPENLRTDYRLNYETTLCELKNIVFDSVKIRCNQKFNAATHLSGGLDSGIVSYIAKNEFKQPVFYGFSWTPTDSYDTILEYDESNLVRSITKTTGIEPIFINPNAFDWLDFLSDWRNSTNLFYENSVRKIAKEKGVNLIFTGFGGDEFLSINDFGVDSDLFFNFQWITLIKKYPLKHPKKLAGALVYNIFLPALSLLYYSKKRPIQYYSKYLTLQSKKKVKTINDLFRWKSRREMHIKFYKSLFIQERTEEWFVNGYRYGVEYRYPLLDKRIIEFMYKIPSKYLFHNGYYRTLIRDIGEGILPEDVRWSKSKNDPVRVDQIYRIFDKSIENLSKELDEYKQNPLFKMIDFKKLDMDIQDYKRGKIKKRPGVYFEILFFLKKTHEFTKSYYINSD